jgi:hypothetical protein
MSAVVKRRWTPVAIEPPALTDKQWYLSSLVGVILVVAAFLQIFSFQDFSNNFSAMGLSSANWWAGGVLLAEIWGAASFFKIRLSWLFRKFSNFFAIAVAGFWFFESVRQVAMAPDEVSPLNTMNYFGRFLAQAPGWWPVIEITAFAFLVVYALEILYERSGAKLPVVTKVNRKKTK